MSRPWVLLLRGYNATARGGPVEHRWVYFSLDNFTHVMAERLQHFTQ